MSEEESLDHKFKEVVSEWAKIELGEETTVTFKEDKTVIIRNKTFVKVMYP